MYSFGPFSFDPSELALTKENQPVKLEPQPAKVLAKLLERSGQIVSREELYEAVWQKGTFVGYEQGLNYCLRKVRQALDDSPSNPLFIETLPKQGYRFIAPVTIAATGSTPPVPLPAPPSAAPPPQRLRWIRYVPVAVGAALLVVAGLSLARPPRQPETSVPSIAIVPLANRTGDPAFDAPADSLTEGLIRELSNTGLLKVYGRATMFSFRGQERNAREAGRTLNANIVLAGHLNQSGKDLILDIEMSDVHDGGILYTHRYLPGPDSWMQVQADLIHDALGSLGANPGVKAARLFLPPSSSPEAYRSYMSAESQIRSKSPASLLLAASSLQRTVQLDPKFALAWSEMALCYLYMGIFFDDPKEWMPQARRAAEEALRLNPSLPGPRAALSLIDLLYDWKVPQANAQLSTAELRHAALSSFSCSSHLLVQTGQFRHAKEEVLDALSFDPRNPELVIEEALRHFDDALRLDPHSAVAYWGMGRALAMQGKYAEAIAFMDRYKLENGFEPPILTAERGFAAGSMGHRQTALECLGQMHTIPSGYVDSYLVATIYLGLHDLDNAFLFLNRALDEKSAFAISVLTDPHWEGVRQDSRFTGVLRRLNF
jgi:DNA-binding winged helix-turn-helix (wHTH) protein/TolB-like protein/tetratricopeptide (TPR) repeat protein